MPEKLLASLSLLPKTQSEKRTKSIKRTSIKNPKMSASIKCIKKKRHMHYCVKLNTADIT